VISAKIKTRNQNMPFNGYVVSNISMNGISKISIIQNIKIAVFTIFLLVYINITTQEG